MDYNIYVVSNKPDKFPAIANKLYPERVHYFNGNNYESFSKLVNSCVASCPSETIIIMSDKVKPEIEHIQKTLDLLNAGYAFVGLYQFAFFGFKKELLRKIGMFDERFVGGGYEDYDFTLRLIESNLSLYITNEVPYEHSKSSWDYIKTWIIFNQKWHTTWDENSQPTIIKRLLPEETYDYNLGPAVPTNFLTCFEHSYTNVAHHVGVFFSVKLE